MNKRRIAGSLQDPREYRDISDGSYGSGNFIKVSGCLCGVPRGLYERTTNPTETPSKQLKFSLKPSETPGQSEIPLKLPCNFLKLLQTALNHAVTPLEAPWNSLKASGISVTRPLWLCDSPHETHCNLWNSISPIGSHFGFRNPHDTSFHLVTQAVISPWNNFWKIFWMNSWRNP